MFVNLFRLPEEAEQDLHQTLLDAPDEWFHSLTSQEQAVTALKEIAGETVAIEEGPQSVGKYSQLYRPSGAKALASHYLMAFRTGYPQLSVLHPLNVTPSAPYTTKLQAGLGLVPETKLLLQLWEPSMSVPVLYQQALESGQFPRHDGSTAAKCRRGMFLHLDTWVMVRLRLAISNSCCLRWETKNSCSFCCCLPAVPPQAWQTLFARFTGPAMRLEIRN